MPRRKRTLESLIAAGAILVAIIAATYWPVLSAKALAQDDNEFVFENALVTRPSMASVTRFFAEVGEPSSVRGYYLPLTMTSLMADWAIGGGAGEFRQFHVTSLCLHIVTALFLMLIVYELFGTVFPAVLVGALFGLHPLGVQPVGWLAERKTLLATMLAFAATWWYVRERSRSVLQMLGTSVLYALALLAKPSVVTLPLILVLLDIWPLRRLSMRGVFHKWPLFLLAAVSTAITIYSLRATAPTTIPDLSPWRMALQACYLVAFYLGKILWPANLSLIYSPPKPYTLANPAIATGVVVTFALFVIAFAMRRRRPAVTIGLLAFFVALLPTFGVLRWSLVIAYDNYVYFPMLGLALIVADVLVSAWNRAPARGSRRLVVAAAAILCVAEIAATRAALRPWNETRSLWQQAVRIAPEVPSAHNGLAVAYLAEYAYPDAERELTRALEIDPNFAQARMNLGIALVRTHRNAEAISHLETARRLMPRDANIEYSLGLAAQGMGKLDEAAAHYRRALELKPDNVEALDRLGSVMALLGRHADALRMLRQAVALAPESSHAHFSLAMVLLYLNGHDAEALTHLELATRYNPQWVEPLAQLAWEKATTPDSAARDAAAALELVRRAGELRGRPDAGLLDTGAAALAAQGRFPEAIETARHAAQIAASAGDDSLAAGIRQRLALYERGMPYVERDRAPR